MGGGKTGGQGSGKEGGREGMREVGSFVLVFFSKPESGLQLDLQPNLNLPCSSDFIIFPLKQAFPSPLLDTTDLFHALILSLWNTTVIFLPQPYNSPATLNITAKIRH